MLTLASLADCNCSLQGIKLFRAMQMLRGCQADSAVLGEHHLSLSSGMCITAGSI